MKKNILYIVLFLLTLVFSTVHIRCESVIALLFNGLLKGLVSSQSGNLALGDASVTQSIPTGDGSGGGFIVIDSTTTDANGVYQFNNVTTGPKLLAFRKGVFRDTILVDIKNNQLYENVNSNLKLISNKKLGYLYGERDSIQTIVQELGYSIDLLPVSTFSNYNNLKDYSIIFINSGTQSISQSFLNHSDIISQYIDSGGKIYSSDWAISLVLNLHLGLQGGPALEGDDQTITSEILDRDLSFFMKKDSASIKYNSDSWNSLSGIFVFPTNARFYNKGTYTLNSGSDTISNESLSFNITNISNGGKVIYTTFRKEAGITADMKKILQFFVFDL